MTEKEVSSTTIKPSRPPADKYINEFIFDKKCAYGANFTKFFDWCRFGTGSVESECRGISATTSNCYVKLWFNVDPANRPNPNWCAGGSGRSLAFDDALNSFAGDVTTVNSTMTDGATINATLNATTEEPSTTPMATTLPSVNLPKNIFYSLNCPFSKPCTGKDQITPDLYELDTEFATKIMDFCEYQINPVIGMPWWLILLIVLATLTAVGIAFSLFWKYWLRRRLYGRQPGEAMSTMGSSYTSAPISNLSGASAYNASGAPSSIRVTSPSNLRSGIRVPSRPSSMRGSAIRSNLASNRSSLSTGSRPRSRSSSRSRSKNPSQKGFSTFSAKT